VPLGTVTAASRAAKRRSIRSRCRAATRTAGRVDNIKPLACGGADVPSNMQWQTVEAAKAKDRLERAAWH
jgi:hypothetical protein